MDVRASVSMAVYNGGLFLLPQLQSILAQLGAADELVIVDDCSTDDSAALLRSMADGRLRLHRNDRNLGVLATFEMAVTLARGDIVFLSDQDDLWLPGKIESILDVFATKPEVTLVASDARIIDVSGSVIAGSYYALRGRFAPGVLRNLVKNKYMGCTLAFRRAMLRHFLPIPRSVPMHDMWFGMVNDIYGKTHFIDRPLIARRRHANNVSPFEGAPLRRGLVWRWHLARDLLLRVMRDRLPGSAIRP